MKKCGKFVYHWNEFDMSVPQMLFLRVEDPPPVRLVESPSASCASSVKQMYLIFECTKLYHHFLHIRKINFREKKEN